MQWAFVVVVTLETLLRRRSEVNQIYIFKHAQCSCISYIYKYNAQHRPRFERVISYSFILFSEKKKLLPSRVTEHTHSDMQRERRWAFRAPFEFLGTALSHSTRCAFGSTLFFACHVFYYVSRGSLNKSCLWMVRVCSIYYSCTDFFFISMRFIFTLFFSNCLLFFLKTNFFIFQQITAFWWILCSFFPFFYCSRYFFL